MASRYETRSALTTLTNENAIAGLAGKNVAVARVGSQRPALGEIGNKALGLKKPNNDLKQASKPAAILSRSKSISGLVTTTAATKYGLKRDGVATETTKAVSAKNEVKTSEDFRNEAEAFSNKRLNVEDIDENDGDNPQLLKVYVNDIYNYMYQLEEQYPVRKHYLDGGKLTSRMRTVLVDWLVDVHYQFHFLQETLYLTVAILDRFLQVDTSITRKQLQLVGVTSMFIGSKYEEMYIPEMGDFAYITDNAYTKEEIQKMEVRILKVIDFNLGRPLPLHFLRRQSKAASATPEHHTLAKYLLELALTDYDFCHCAPSRVAAASLCLSLGILDSEKTLSQLWSDTLVYYSRYRLKDIMPLVKKLAILLAKTETSKYQAVQKKYASRKMLKISTRPELKCKLVKELAISASE